MIKTYFYFVRVEPHLTDYAGVVWHGSYLRWLEEARIDALRQVGLEYADLVQLGCDLPVLKLKLNYRRSLRMGDRAVVKSRLLQRDRIRLIWEQNVYHCEDKDSTHDQVAVEGQVTLAPVDIKKQRIMRRIPNNLEQTLDKLMFADSQDKTKQS